MTSIPLLGYLRWLKPEVKSAARCGDLIGSKLSDAVFYRIQGSRWDLKEPGEDVCLPRRRIFLAFGFCRWFSFSRWRHGRRVCLAMMLIRRHLRGALAFRLLPPQ